MGSGLALAGGGDTDVAGVLAKGGQIGGSEVAHAALEATDQLAQSIVNAAGDLFESFNSLGGDLIVAGGVIGFTVAVADGGTGFHGAVAAHAAVLLIEFPINLHDAAGGLHATGEQTAAHDGIGEGEGLDEVAAFGDATIGDGVDPEAASGFGADVECGKLGDADAGDDAGGADGAWPLADFDGIGPAFGEVLEPFGGSDISGDEGEVGKFGAEELEDLADAAGVAVGGGNGEDIDPFPDEVVGMGEDAVAVEFAAIGPRGGDGGSAAEAEGGVAGGADGGPFLFPDALNVGHGEEPLEDAMVVENDELMDTHVVGEEAIGGVNGIITEIFFADGKDLVEGGHGVDDADAPVAIFNDTPAEEAEEPVVLIDDGERMEFKAPLFDHGEYITDVAIGADGNRFLNQAVDIIFDPSDQANLIAFGHIVMDDADTAVAGHGGGHGSLGDGIHIGGEEGNVEFKLFGDAGIDAGLAREDLAEAGGEGDIVEGEANVGIGGKEGIRILVEDRIEGVGGIWVSHIGGERPRAHSVKREGVVCR